MIQSFTLMSERVKRLGRQRIAVAAAQDEELLRSIAQAWELGIADPILIGNKGEIEKIAAGSGLDLAPFDLIDEPDDRKACRLAVRLVRQGAAGYDICFLHPKSNEEFPIAGEGVLIELVQAPADVIAALG